MELDTRVYLDIYIGGLRSGRMEIELFEQKARMAADNFRFLCDGFVKKDGDLLHYKNSFFHKVIAGVMCEGGDITEWNGRGGESIYGKVFPDQDLSHGKHTRGTVSMANNGPDTNLSRFFICFRNAPQFDGRNTIFGRVVVGEEVLDMIEEMGRPGDGKTTEIVEIRDCGLITPIITTNEQFF